ncbi:CopG family transcriptional regulator [Oleomonas cavernae]|uniref:CopG family transcriptional regulator n=1 Tax=Oleomonas cavernae TaxID=2320859 RepID=A0A418WIN4_9PROT|nr:CopG family transcriptional regulator [Oleomonas cavernae]
MDGAVSPADADTLADISAGMAEADEGDFVPHEEVEAWLRSWGTPNELPPPRWK